MIVDGRTLEEGTSLEADVAIVGAGAAGISLALDLERQTQLSIVLLEGGDMERSEESQSNYAGESVGWASRNASGDDLIYDRIRAFGGSTWAWGGQCRPLEEIDFEQRDWVPGSGWPIGAVDLVPFYPRAHEYLMLGQVEYDYATWSSAIIGGDRGQSLPELPGMLPCLFQWARKTRFASMYYDRIGASARIRLISQANLIGVSYRDDADNLHLDSLSLRSFAGNGFSVKARRFVFAMGGIENARQLLLHGPERTRGFGNAHDHLGRYFQQHSYLMSGTVKAPRSSLAAIEYHRKFLADKQQYSLMLRLDDTIQKREKTLNYSASLFHSNALTALSRLTFALTNWSYYWNRVPGDLRHIRREFKAFVDYHTRPQRDYVIYHGLEQAPNPNSRVSLGYPKDRFGLQQVRLDWQFCELDFHTFRTGQKRFAQSIQERGLGKVELAYTGDDARWDRVDGGAHHIGTTRMAARKQNGVVDADQRVFGTENLYVAGSSVFPTSGVANPTLTILATTLRLADKLSATTQ